MLVVSGILDLDHPQTGDQANINTASADLVNRLAQQVTTPGSDVNTLIRQIIDNRLTSLAGRNLLLWCR